MDKIIVTTPTELTALVRQAVKSELAALSSPGPAALTIAEAASYLHLDKSTLDRYRVEKRGPAYAKIGSRVIYRKIDLDAWLAQCRIKTLDSDSP